MEENRVIPDSVMDSVKKTSFNVEQVRTHLLQLLSLSDPDVLAEMSPLERAQLLFLLAKATTILYTCNFSHALIKLSLFIKFVQCV